MWMRRCFVFFIVLLNVFASMVALMLVLVFRVVGTMHVVVVDHCVVGYHVGIAIMIVCDGCCCW